MYYVNDIASRYFDMIFKYHVLLTLFLQLLLLYPVFCYVLCSMRYRCIRRVADEIDENTFRRKEWKDVTPADEYEGMLSPEDVCLMERGLSADFRLTSLGIVQAMEVSKIEQALSRMNKLKDFMRSRLKVATEMANVHRGTARGKSLAMLVDILEIQRDKLKKEIDVGRYGNTQITAMTKVLFVDISMKSRV